MKRRRGRAGVAPAYYPAFCFGTKPPAHQELPQKSLQLSAPGCSQDLETAPLPQLPPFPTYRCQCPICPQPFREKQAGSLEALQKEVSRVVCGPMREESLQAGGARLPCPLFLCPPWPWLWDETDVSSEQAENVSRREGGRSRRRRGEEGKPSEANWSVSGRREPEVTLVSEVGRG